VRRSLPLRPAILRMVWQVVERFGEQAAHSPQSIAWSRGLWRNPARQSLPLRPAILRMVWQVVERFGEQAAYSPQSFAWCRRLWRNPLRRSVRVQYAIHRMVSPEETADVVPTIAAARA
jgi:cytochrome c-type biogenesis protein CcmH/NrfF